MCGSVLVAVLGAVDNSRLLNNGQSRSFLCLFVSLSWLVGSGRAGLKRMGPKGSLHCLEMITSRESAQHGTFLRLQWSSFPVAFSMLLY